MSGGLMDRTWPRSASWRRSITAALNEVLRACQASRTTTGLLLEPLMSSAGHEVIEAGALLGRFGDVSRTMRP